MIFEFNVVYHPRTHRWAVNTYIDGIHIGLKNFDTIEEMEVYFLDVVPPDSK